MRAAHWRVPVFVLALLCAVGAGGVAATFVAMTDDASTINITTQRSTITVPAPTTAPAPAPPAGTETGTAPTTTDPAAPPGTTAPETAPPTATAPGGAPAPPAERDRPERGAFSPTEPGD